MSERDEVTQGAVRRVVRAWEDPGPRPDIHRRAQRDLRKDWPALAHAIESLASEAREQAERMGP